ncbi:hypothetical protein Tco_1246109 [Tanacetum coccineum]
MDLNKFVVKDDMIDYVLHKYGSNWQVHDAIADDILDDLLKREREKQKRVKYDNRKVIIIESDTSYDYFLDQTTSDESSNHNPFQATSDESSDHNPFQVTSDESSNDTLKSSSEDTCSSDSVTTWQQILNKEFGMKRSKENVVGSSNVRRKGKRKML